MMKRLLLACLLAALVLNKTLKMPDQKTFAVNLGLKVVYNEKNVDFSMRIHVDDWAQDQFQVLMSPTLYGLNDIIKSKSAANAKDFTDFDILHSVRLSMLQTLFMVMKFFMIKEADFPTRFHIVKAFYTYAVAMKVKEKSFNIMVKLKDEAAMKITVLLDQPKVKKFLDESEVFDLDKTYEAPMYRQYAGQDFIKAGTVDFRGMLKGVEKHMAVAVFSHHSKGFFQSLRSAHGTSLKFMGENMKFDLITGFAKMVEANISDEATDKSKVPATVQFLKDKDFEGYDVPAEDIMYKDLPNKPKKKEKEE